MLPAESVYMFNGQRFLDYVDYEIFKSEIEKNLHFVAKDRENFTNFYTRLHYEHPDKHIIFDRILFDNMFYGQLKNVFVTKFSKSIAFKEREFKSRVKKIIKDINIDNDNIPVNYKSDMSENGFYLLDCLNIDYFGTTFIAGFDYEIGKKFVDYARFLFVEVVQTKDDKAKYFLAAVDVDFKNKRYTVLIRNIQANIKKIKVEDTDELSWDSSIVSILKKVDDQVLKTLGITGFINVKEDRAGMFNMCKELDDGLLSDIRQMVKKKTEEEIATATDILFGKLFSGESVSKFEKDSFRERTQSILLASYINLKIKSTDLVKKAKKLDLVGYTTRINFDSNKSNQSSTRSGSSKVPIAHSEMFHSLYTDFSASLSLRKWSFAWFFDIKQKSPGDIEVMQTTIETTSKLFKITFLPDRHLNKELIFHVIEYIDKYRNY